jgi:hypothetical protein
MGRKLGVGVACLFLAVPLVAGTLADVTMPDQIVVDGHNLVLNGMGLRIKKIAFIKIKVYVAGLYLPAKSSDANAILTADEPKRMVMHFLYKEVGRDKLVEAWNEGFENNAGTEMPAIEQRLAQFNDMWMDMKSGDEAVLTYVPDKGTTVEIRGETRGVVPGSDFARALFSVWLGPEPPNKELKEGLLGK